VDEMQQRPCLVSHLVRLVYCKLIMLAQCLYYLLILFSFLYKISTCAYLKLTCADMLITV